jgi:hypothetical protein
MCRTAKPTSEWAGSIAYVRGVVVVCMIEVSHVAENPGSRPAILGIAPTRIPAAEPDLEAGRRQELRAFLMSRRARLQPKDVGLPQTARRRTPGLRREEVAQLAGLSTEWYTLFEMAKDTGVSTRTIDEVAKALRLSAAETRHLHNLVTGELVQAPSTDPSAAVDPTLLDLLEGYQAGPAMLLNARMDVVASNRLAVAIFGLVAHAEGDKRNWLWYLYTNHHLIEEWDTQARQLTATFRGVYCEHATEAAYSGLLERLLATSETFRRYWNEHDVSPLDDAPPLTLTHPAYGPLRFTMRVLTQTAAAPTYCCFLVPDEATANAPAYRDLRHAIE